MKEAFDNYMNLYFETVDKNLFNKNWLKKLGSHKGFVPYLTRRPFNYDEFVIKCQKDSTFRKQILKEEN